ncbi:peptide chain release factor N(5)-glutamine methyltransferase [Rickettsiales bacterium LUAb2]
MNIKQAITYFSSIFTLAEANILLEIRMLIQHYCNLSDIDYLTKQNDYILPTQNINLILNAIKQRNTGFPMAYILGYKYFWQDKFIVNQDVLIPRPETELIIEEILNLYNDTCSKLNILDIGTGSGCIILSLLKIYKHSFGIASDISKAALEITKLNAANLNIPKERLLLLCQNLMYALNPNNFFNIIISNPPYIDKNDTQLNEYVKKYEPNLALFANNNGLFFYEQILKSAKNHLTDNGYLIFEIGINQSEAIITLAKQYGFVIKKIILDYNKIQRILIFQ